MHRRSNLQCNQLYNDFSVNDFNVTGNVRCDTPNLPQGMRPFANRMCNNYDYTKNGLKTYGAYPTKTCSKLYKSNQPVQSTIIEETPETVTIQTSTPAVVVTEVPSVKVTEEPVVQVTEQPVVAVETFKRRKTNKESFTNGKVTERLAPYPSSLTSYSAYPYVTLYDIPTMRPIPEYNLQNVPFYYADGVVMPTTIATKSSSIPITYIPSTPIIAGNRCAGTRTLNPVLVSQERGNYAVMPHFVPTVPVATATIGVPTRNSNMFVAIDRN